MAKQKKIPVVEVQHGIYVPNKFRADVIVDFIAAGGEYSKKVFVDYGVEEEKIKLTGWPKFDRYCQMNKLRESNLPAIENRNIIFATQPLDFKINISIINALISFAQSEENVNVIIKPHPTENKKRYEENIVKKSHVFVLDPDSSIADIINNISILITISSTVAMEAAMLKKPVICYRINGEITPFEALGIAKGVSNEEELTLCLHQLMNEQKMTEELSEQENALDSLVFGLDGKSTFRVCKLLHEIAEKTIVGR